MVKDFRQAVAYSHYIFERHLNPGVRVVDATTGNGYDTEFLARLVGEKGFVYGFDIQKKALENTEQRLCEAGLKSRVKLIHDGHENLAVHIKEPVAGILFNLGYLPGGNKEIITTPSKTLAALKAGLQLLTENGLIIMVVYSGHSGGKQERKSLLHFCQQLSEQKYNVLSYHFLNQKNEPPCLVGIKKR